MAALTACAWGWLTPASQAEPSAPLITAEAVAPPAQTLQAQDRVEAETVTLGPEGFEPAEVRRPAGRFLLAVNNLPGPGRMTLRLEREGGELLQEVTLTHNQRRWRKVVALTAGAYALTVADHPGWRCLITVY